MFFSRAMGQCLQNLLFCATHSARPSAGRRVAMHLFRLKRSLLPPRHCAAWCSTYDRTCVASLPLQGKETYSDKVNLGWTSAVNNNTYNATRTQPVLEKRPQHNRTRQDVAYQCHQSPAQGRETTSANSARQKVACQDHQSTAKARETTAAR